MQQAVFVDLPVYESTDMQRDICIVKQWKNTDTMCVGIGWGGGGREAEKTTGLLEELGHFCRSYLGMVLLCKRATIFLLIYHSQSISKNCF